MLGIPRKATEEKVEEQFQKTMKMYEAAGSEEEGAARVLRLRLRRAYELLRNTEARKAFDSRRRRQIERLEWSKLRYANGLYQGCVEPESMKNGEPVRSGKGLTVLASGEKHEGEYLTNQRCGIGLQFWQNGDLYLGQWQNDKMSGHGCYYYGNGSGYAVEFSEGRRHGVGLQIWPDGSVYSGEFFEGWRTGQGKLQLPKGPDGDPIGCYEGEWEDGNLEGKGVYTSPTLGHYEVEFQASCFHGQGKLKLPNGDVYEGSFMQGKRDGQGAYRWPDGDEYVGPMRGNQRNGHGILTSPLRDLKFEGQWQRDLPQGKGRMSQRVDSEGGGCLVYKGQWDSGVREGQGICSWPSGSHYIGHFAGNKKHGTGVFEWPDGSTFDGTYLGDLRDGAGVYSQPRDEDVGTQFEELEIWRKGELVNKETKN